MDITKKTLIRQLERVFTGPAWHGPSVLETLGPIQVEHAQNRFKDSHTLIELIAHMATWRKFVIEKLSGNDLYDVSKDQDFATPTDLMLAIKDLKDTQLKLITAIQNFPEESLKEKVPGREYSFQTMLHGILHHDLYHLGQIGLLKR